MEGEAGEFEYNLSYGEIWRSDWVAEETLIGKEEKLVLQYLAKKRIIPQHVKREHVSLGREPKFVDGDETQSCGIVMKMTSECSIAIENINVHNLAKKHGVNLIHTNEKAHKGRKGFRSKCNLREDVQTEEKVHNCVTCGTIFTQKAALERHAYLHTGEKRYKCNSCRKQFNWKCNLRTHMYIHTGEKPYKCETCGKGFNHLSNVKSHMRIHSEKPYKCETCGKEFNYRSNMKAHMSIRTGETQFKCRTCEKTNKNTHARLHKCVTCGKEFKSKSYLRKHECLHTDKNPYILEDQKLSEPSTMENEHYYHHTTKIESNQDSPPGMFSGEYKTEKYNNIKKGKKGRGRPKKNGGELKEWSDEEIYKLIELWGSHDILYNYLKKSEKPKAVERLRKNLEAAGIPVTTQQIFDKLKALRNYYGTVKKKTESLKREGFDGEEVYYCRWQFYQPLSFLDGTFSPRQSRPLSRESLDQPMEQHMQANDMIHLNQPMDNLIHSNHTHPVTHPVINSIQPHANDSNQVSQLNHINKSTHPNPSNELPHNNPSNNPSNHANEQDTPNQSNHTNQPSLPLHPNHHAQAKLTNALNHTTQRTHVNLPHDNNHAKHNCRSHKTEDQLFGELVAQMVSGIIDSEEKALLLIRIQQDIIQTKFRVGSALLKRCVHATPETTNQETNATHATETNNHHAYYTKQKALYTNEYYTAQKTYHSNFSTQHSSLEHSPLSSRSDSPHSLPACLPKLNIMRYTT